TKTTTTAQPATLAIATPTTAIAKAGVAPTPIGDPCAMGTPNPLLRQPCVRRVVPESAAAGMSVYIKGTGVSGTSERAERMGANVVSDTVILLVVGSGTPNTNIPIVVTNPASGRTSAGSFKLLPTHIVSFFPHEGRSGDRVTINGYGFSTNGLPGVTFADGRNP